MHILREFIDEERDAAYRRSPVSRSASAFALAPLMRSVSTCRKVMAQLYPLINMTRAGGWDEIERLLPIANAVLKQAFLELPPLTLLELTRRMTP